MSSPDTNDAWTTLDAEVEHWREAGRVIRLWLRDDDAIEPTASLERLIRLANTYRAPVLLAVIPGLMNPELAGFLARERNANPAVHGYAHRSHARPGEKKIELGGGRATPEILDELSRSRTIMTSAFGAQASEILVPPWNRISPDVAGRVQEIGFTAISAFGWKSTGAALRELHAHVDLIDWKAGRIGKNAGRIASELVDALATARRHDFAPVGILTHHLIHDETAWATLHGLLAWSALHEDVTWHRAHDLLAE